MLRIAVCLIILFLALSQAWSQEVDSLTPQCNAFVADSSSKPEKLKAAEATCARDFANFRCSDVAKAYPSVKEHLKKCDAKSICNDEVKLGTVPTMALGWIRGMGTSAWDTVVALGDTASALGQWAWKKAYEDPKAAVEISRKCDANIDCKRAVAAQVPWRKSLSDEDLKNYSSLKLQTEALVYEGLQKLNSVKSSASDCVRDPQSTMLSAKQSLEEMKKYAGAKLDALDDWRYDTSVRQVMQYYCVDLFGQAEFVGYRTLPVLPTSALAGAASNLARGAKATQAAAIETKAVAAAEALAPARNAELVSQNLASASERTPAREAFNHQNLNKTFTTPEQNQKFVSIAENVTKADGKTVFVDMENSVMKLLNDRTRDKNLVTSLTNRHKAILSEGLKELQAANPGLEISLYSDFKSMRLALHGKVPENIEEQLQALWGKANTRFSTELKESMLIRSEDPAHIWFRGGVGETADIANLFAREARNQGEVNLLMTAKSSPEIISRLNSRLSEVESLRGSLVNDLKGTALLDTSSRAKPTLSREAFDLVRKYTDPETLQMAVIKRFGDQSFSRTQAEAMIGYAKGVDEFSPGIHVIRREIVNLDEAENGGFSVDFLGLGSANQSATAKALANSNGITETIVNARIAEKSVTSEFQSRLERFKQIAGNFAKCSGDDCVGLATKTLSTADKQSLLNNLAADDLTRSVRVAFVSDNVAVADRTTLGTHGESIEKFLRKKLEGKIASEKMSSSLFGVDMQTRAANSGEVALLVAAKPGVKFTSREWEDLQEAFRQAVKAHNADLAKDGVNSVYRATTSSCRSPTASHICVDISTGL